MLFRLTLLFLGVCFISTSLWSQEEKSVVKTLISLLPDLPSVIKEKKSLGYAGMIGGKHNKVILAAGGVNFSESRLEEEKRVWSDVIFIFEENDWRISKTKLPKPLAYASYVPTAEGILVIGGRTKFGVSKSVFLLKYDEFQKAVKLITYPSLMEPLAFSSAVLVEDDVYLIGGSDGERSSNSVFRLNLETKKKWEKLTDFPGEPRCFSSAVVQETANTKKIFVFGGSNVTKGKKYKAQSDYIAYDLKKQEWDEAKSILVSGKPLPIMAASIESKGSMHILLYGGANATVFSTLEQLEGGISPEISRTNKEKSVFGKKIIQNSNSGFRNEILALNTFTNRWFTYDTLSSNPPVSALSFQDEDTFFMISGKISPSEYTSSVRKFNIVEDKRNFGTINYVVLFTYLTVTLLIGLYFSNKQNSTKDYFIGGGRVPWWASGISIFGTILSALTFMAIPAKSFLTDWSYFLLNITAILIVPVIVFLFVPYFNRLNITTAYEFLEKRFNYLARVLGSHSFILFQLGRIGIVLLLPSLAIAIVTGIPVEICVLIMGVLCIVYTTFGGLEAVIWTDVLQVVVLLGGSILSIFWLLEQSNVTITEAYVFAADRNKFNIANMELNFSESTFWVVFLGGLASALITQGTDQTIVQRYLTSSSVREAQKTSYMNAALTLPASIIFFGIGTLLFIFYSNMPERLPPNLSNNDAIFPWYIVHELPNGISGLLIAAIFSAAMSSLSSSLNSMSMAFCNDFYKHYVPNVPDLKLLKIARITNVIMGSLGIMLALWMASSNIKSLWDQFLLFIGLLTAGLGGMFLLGMVTKKANARGTLLGVLLSTVFLGYLSFYTTVSILMYSFLGMTSCFISGYFFSLLFKDKNVINN